MSCRALAKQANVMATIVAVQKDGATIDPRCVMERDARDIQASLAGHECSGLMGESRIHVTGGV